MIKKVCFAASSGGHLEEISRLREIRDRYDCFLFTESGSFEELNFCEKVYYVKQINRKEKGFLFHFLQLWMHADTIMKKEDYFNRSSGNISNLRNWQAQKEESNLY